LILPAECIYSRYAQIHKPISMKAFLLVLGSILVSLFLFEAGLRTLGGNKMASAGLARAMESDRPLDVREAMRYVDQIPVAAGTERKWFLDDPPPLVNRGSPRPERAALYQEYVRRGVFPDQSDYVWNRFFVETNRCAPNSRFKNFPEKVLAFDPPSPGVHPFYRFPPNTTGVAGLVTNEFGFRGPPISLKKPSKTIRIAFIGASTTVGFHNFPFSYPERVTFWLNRFADANRLNVHFEGLNGGREAINSEDMEAVLRNELLPLDPDLAVYNGGANQFPSANQLVSPHIPPREKIDPNDPVARHVVPEFLRTHSAVGDLVDRAVNGFSAAGEPRKPSYRLNWPAGVDEQNPTVDDPGLPLQLPVIVKDLDAMRSSLKSIAAQLWVSSFEWYASDQIQLSPVRHRFIYEQLNTVFWPLRYADIRRLATFQNRVLQRYAASRGIPFVDIQTSIPQDPNLFDDALHLTDAGERLKAWVVFQQLAPVIRQQISAGALPRPAGLHALPPPPSLTTREVSTHCEDPTGPFTKLDGVVSLAAMQTENGATTAAGSGVKLVTPAPQWAYAARIPIHIPATFSGAAFFDIRLQVLTGQAGVGVLDTRTGDFQIERNVVPTPVLTDVYVPVLSPETAGDLVIRNAAGGNTRSEILIQKIELVTPSNSK
jgi:GDSL-like Lipase/Acylhydrolase family